MGSGSSKSRERKSKPPEDLVARVAKVVARILGGDFPAGDEDLAAIEEGLGGGASADVLDALVAHLGGGPAERDAASAILDVIAARARGPEAILAAARRLPRETPARVLMLAVASEAGQCKLEADEKDEALLGPLRLMAREAALSAVAANGLAEKWAPLDDAQRDALLAWFEAAAEGTAEALVLSACVIDHEIDPKRTERLLRLVAGSGHPDARRVLERVAASGHRTRSVAARRALLAMGSALEPEAPSSVSGADEVVPGSAVAMLTGVDGFGRFETLLAVPRFAAIWELVVLRVEVDDGRPVSAACTPLADRADIEEFARVAAEEGLLLTHVSPGEASEIVLRAVSRLPEDRAGRDAAMAAAARVASGMTRRSLLPPAIGTDDEGLAEHPALARAGLPLRGAARSAMLVELEVIFARAKGSADKLAVLVQELAKTLAARFDGAELRAGVAARLRHQSSVLRALGDHEMAGRAAFASKLAAEAPLADSAAAVRLIANGILAEIRRSADDPDEGAFRRALRERFFEGQGPTTLSDLEALDFLEVLAETLADRGVELPDEAVSAMRVVAEEVHEAVRASGPFRRLPVAGGRAPVLPEQALVDIAGRVLSRTLDRLPAAVSAEAAAELGAFVAQMCLSHCPQRCFEDPPADLGALLRSDEHPCSLPRQPG